jgi:3-oxoacyl-[acyl-carrier-protein] synthase-1
VSVVATGFGVVSPLGHSAAATCAAIRAGISNFVELESMVDRAGDPVIASVLTPRPLGDEPLGPVLAACREAISDCRMTPRSGPGTISILTGDDSKPRPHVFKEADAERLARALDLNDFDVVFYRHGHAAAFHAINDVGARLERNPASFEIVVGADSLVGLPTLAYLERSHRLKGGGFPRGLIPGEACACVIFQESAHSPVRSRQPRLRLVSAYTSTEPAPVGSDAPCLGDGLTAAIQGAMDRARWTPDDVGQVYCDLNGESYRAHEWMLALCRCLADPDVVHPADCIADVGAAFGPLLLCLAATAMQRGYARGPRAIAFCSSDAGLRGCACVELSEA